MNQEKNGHSNFPAMYNIFDIVFDTYKRIYLSMG